MQASTEGKTQLTLAGLWYKCQSLSWEPLRDNGVKVELLKYKSSKLLPKKNVLEWKEWQPRVAFLYCLYGKHGKLTYV